MFVDEATIRVKAGDGGNGCMAFRREKFVPRGGPSGGDGGRGGDVIMESSERHNTLVHFRFNPEYKAERGRHGEGSNKTGREGDNVVLRVPVGTMVYDEMTGETGARLLQSRRARGDRAGRARRPRQCALRHLSSPGPARARGRRPGEERDLASRTQAAGRCRSRWISQRRQEHSDLAHLGGAAQDCRLSFHHAAAESRGGGRGRPPDERSFVVADIPGLIEGASEGAGLGTQFLRHIERTRLLAHLVDVSDSSGRPDPVEDFEVITRELANFGEGLNAKPTIIVASKIDVANPDKLAKLKRYASARSSASMPSPPLPAKASKS